MQRKLILLSQIVRYPFSDLFDDYIDHQDFDWNTVDKNTYICFGGGTDVNPAYYGEPVGAWTMKPDYQRDVYEATIFRKCVGRVGGFIGICRGSQFLTVLNGGKLFQDVDGHAMMGVHRILTPDGEIWATSTHHQMMNPFKMHEDHYKIIAQSAPSRGHKYYNGYNVDMGPPPSEPEIVWYPQTDSLAIQGHPEYVPQEHEFSKYCRKLVEDYLFKPKLIEQPVQTKETV
jgi:hypothetical protein